MSKMSRSLTLSDKIFRHKGATVITKLFQNVMKTINVTHAFITRLAQQQDRWGSFLHDSVLMKSKLCENGIKDLKMCKIIVSDYDY